MSSRGIEYDLLPLMQQHQIPVMAYCPLAQAGQLRRGLMRHPTLQALAGQHHATVPQIMLAFLLARPGVIPIPRTGRAEHTLQNARAAEIRLSAEELALLDKAFAPPQRKVRLEIV